MEQPSFDAIGIVTSDLGRSVEFYGLLGLRFPDDPQGHVETVLPGGTRLMLDLEEVVVSFDTGFTSPSGAGRISLAFLCESPAAVDAAHAAVVAAGFDSHLEPFDAVWGQRYATVLDPDGNKVDLFALL